MTTISLREYNRSIENLINQGKPDLAVDHSKQILKQFPKHIDTYRLLGKACLQNKKYDEAADIFQRVLSVIPEDFSAQIGMSVIRESQGNLDEAIWHMERAYEAEPSNPSIPEEIRRLYEKRDGVQPARVRLSRGSLIRMYIQGGLYNQAISEARAALADNSQRGDLELLLARIYYLSGNKMEAAEICTQIISKLPYCLEANKILTIILSTMGRVNEANAFQQRINAIEPYSAFISKNTPSLAQVPDQAVTLEQLDLPIDDDDLGGQQVWGQVPGIGAETLMTDAPSEWLQLPEDARLKGFIRATDPVTSDEFMTSAPTEPAGSSQYDNYPDWLGTIQKDSLVEDNQELQFDEKSQIGLDKLLQENEIPEWLQIITTPTNGSNASVQEMESNGETSNPSEPIQPDGQEDLDISEKDDFESLPDGEAETGWLEKFRSRLPEETSKFEGLPSDRIHEDDHIEIMPTEVEDIPVPAPEVTPSEGLSPEEGNLLSAPVVPIIMKSQGELVEEIVVTDKDATFNAVSTELFEDERDLQEQLREILMMDETNSSAVDPIPAGQTNVDQSQPAELEPEWIVKPVENEIEIENLERYTVGPTTEPNSTQPQESEDQPVLTNLDLIRHSISNGSLDDGIEQIMGLIEAGENVHECIDILEQIRLSYPDHARIWQCLGDAYAKIGEIQQAFSAYCKAEELLS